MNPNLYKRPNKPATVYVARRPTNYAATMEAVPVVAPPPAVWRGTECHVTPSAVAARMAGYLEAAMPHPFGLRGRDILEPSCGTGNLVAALLEKAAKVCGVERHAGLAEYCQGRFGELAHIVEADFLEWSSVGLFNGCLINPPFSKAHAHIAKALSMVHENASLVALVPVTFEWDGMVELERLPVDTFANAKVITKIVILRI